MNGPTGGRRSSSPSARTPLCVATRSGAVALVAAVVTAGVLAVTGASAVQDSPPLPTTTTTEGPLEPIEVPGRLVAFSCRTENFAVLVPADPASAQHLASMMYDLIGQSVMVIDQAACGDDEDQQRYAWWPSDFFRVPDQRGEHSDVSDSESVHNSLAVELMFGPFESRQVACEAMMLMSERLAEPKGISDEETLQMTYLNNALRVSRPGSGDPENDPAVIVDCGDNSAPSVPATPNRDDTSTPSSINPMQTSSIPCRTGSTDNGRDCDEGTP